MTTIRTALESASAIENIVAGAQVHATLISPWVQLSDAMAARIADADRWRVPVTLVFRDEPERVGDRRFLATLHHARFLAHPTLHAKCFANEHELLITSLNLYEYSVSRNRELGVLLRAGNSPFDDAVREAQAIIAAATAVRFDEGPPYAAHPVARTGGAPTAPRPATSAGRLARTRPGRPRTAYCITCKAAVHFAPARPYCRRCYADGLPAEARGGERPLGRHCHACGDTSGAYNREHPVCPRCRERLTTRR